MQSSVNVACALSAVVLSVLLVSSAQGAVQISDFTSWTCINNASCLNDVAVRVARQLNTQETVDLGLLRIQPIEPRTQVVEGRSLPSASFFDRNAIQIPFMSWLINFEPSETKAGFFQVSVSPKEDARSLGDARGRIKNRLRTRTMILPFLAMNAIGWLLFAIFAVKVLTIKAFLVAKLAFLLTSVMTMKKFMETAIQRAAPLMNHPEFLPFNSVEVDGGFPAGSDIMPYHMAAAGGHNPFQNSLVAESNINAVVDANNSTSAVAPKAPSKIKRQDVVGNRKNLYYNYVAQRSPIYSYRQVY